MPSSMRRSTFLCASASIPVRPTRWCVGRWSFPTAWERRSGFWSLPKVKRCRKPATAGADHVGADDLVAKIQEGWFDFDTAIATPDMMGMVGKIGKLLGPRGLMPNPKVGTVTFDIGRAVTEAKSGKISYRVEKAGIVHAPVGKVSFSVDKLQENVVSLVDALVKAKPSTAKGTYLKKVSLSSTMGPGVNIDVPALQALVK